jgi:hypothetical protein
MSKFIALAAVVGAVLMPAAAANAATSAKLSGVVVAKETARHTLIVASSHGNVTTIRATARQFRTTRLNYRISARVTTLADGSVNATRLKHLGKAKKARLNVTVLQEIGPKLVVAGGGSAFAFRLTESTRFGTAARRSLSPGDSINASVDLSRGGMVGHAIKADGASVLIYFSGKVTAMDATSLTISTDGVSTVVAIPDGVSLPPLVQVGGEVQVVASISGGTLTLVAIKIDSDGDGGGCSVGGDASVHVEGFVTSLDAGSITIQPGDNASPVTFAIPDGFTLPAGLTAGSNVEAGGSVVNSVLTLAKLELQGDGGDAGEVRTEGTVTALDAGSITIQPADSGSPLTFTIPDGFSLPSGLQVGSIASAKGEMVSSVLTLTKIKLHRSHSGDVEAWGKVTALDSTSVTIQSRHSSVIYAIPSGFTLPSGLQVGSPVDAEGQYVGSVLTLTQIALQTGGHH